MTELPDAVRQVDDPLIKLLVEYSDALLRDLTNAQEREAYWKGRAEEADRRVGDLETERFAR